MKHLRLLFVLLFLGIVCLAQGQNNIIKGFIYNSEDGAPIAHCPVHLLGTSHGSVSERNGSFVISKVPDGEYTLTVSFFGFDSIRENITLKGNQTITKKYYLSPSKISLDAVNVSAEQQRVITTTNTSVVSVTPKEIKKMPSIGGMPDFAQYLQVLPGVVSTGDQGGQLYIRGGTPIQNMVLLDGMLVFNPFHSIGLFSVFDTDIMSSADVYTGGFGAEFGGRISSIMDIKTRDGNRKRFSGKVDVNTFGAKVLLEGPIVKLKDDRKTSLSYVISAKGSYLEQTSKALYPYADENGLPYNYLDFYAKLSLATANGTKLNIFGFDYNDAVHYKDIATYKWNSWGAGTNFLIVPGNVPTTIEGTIAYSKYKTILDDYAFTPRESSINGFTANLNFNYYVGKSLITVGAELLGYTTKYTLYNTMGIKVGTKDNTTDIGIFIKYKYNYRDKLLLEPSFRLQYYASMNAASPEPRLAIKYNITKKIRLKLAGGLYSQNFVAATSDRDVVNLFYGFLSSPDDMSAEFDGKEMRNNLQKAQHVVLGLELDVIKHTSINIEGYFKNFSQLTTLNRYKVYEDVVAYSHIPDIQKKDYIFEKGYAYGADVTAKFEYKGLYVWFVYSLAWVKRYDGVVTYSPHFDRRHNVNLMLSYAFGKNRTWQIDVRWNYGSGFPFTQTQGYYGHYNPTCISDDYIHANEDMGFFLADLNAARLPDYHRLDINFKKKFHIGERHVLELNVGATNLYNYHNIFYVNRVTNGIIYQLPILYSFGLNWSF